MRRHRSDQPGRAQLGRPARGGGRFEKTAFQAIPNKFEAGTGNIAGAVGLGAALAYVSRIGIEQIDRHEHALPAGVTARLASAVAHLARQRQAAAATMRYMQRRDYPSGGKCRVVGATH